MPWTVLSRLRAWGIVVEEMRDDWILAPDGLSYVEASRWADRCGLDVAELVYIAYGRSHHASPPAMTMANYKTPGPQVAAFLRSDHRLRALIGPVYAGRKSAAFYDILRRAARFPQEHSWRWVVVSFPPA